MELTAEVELNAEYATVLQELRLIEGKLTVKRSEIEGMCKEISLYQENTSTDDMKTKLKQETESMLKWIDESEKWILTIDDMAREERKKNEDYRRQLRFRMKTIRS
jgi:hypothetical protein